VSPRCARAVSRELGAGIVDLTHIFRHYGTAMAAPRTRFR
jgi:hypothetical protein